MTAADTRSLTPQRRSRRLLRAVVVLFLLLALVVAAGAFWLYLRARASLPQLDGEVALAPLSAPVTVERDANGVPRVTGSSRRDLAAALGFLHAQDRFFQMDLLRRRSAGELAALVPAAVRLDRRFRVHRFRARAEAAVAALPEEQGQLLDAYTDGVNAGLAALGDVPFEYLLLRQEPAPWVPADSLLAGYSMYLELQDETAERESVLGVLYDTLPRPLADFLAPRGTSWDAPVVGEPLLPPPVPGPDVFDLRSADAPRAEEVVEPSARDASPFAGSNNWAVAGWHTGGGALVANDMHLGLSLPNTWYRAELLWPDGAGGQNRLVGVTLPGIPGVLVGSNGHVAWGFTNSYGDWFDLVVLESPADDEDAYLTPDGPRPFTRYEEKIEVAGGKPETLEVLETIWGPVIDRDHAGRRRALRWVAHDPRGMNLELLHLEGARTVEEALAVANSAGLPAQNFVVGDTTGAIAWTVAGPVPRRVGFEGRLPTSWASGERRWDGYLPAAEVPRVVNPAEGFLWSANARVVGGEMLAKIGDGGYDVGARAGQIRDRLRRLNGATATPGDMLAIQLDDRARFMERWHSLLQEVLQRQADGGDTRAATLAQLAEETWTGYASVDSVAYRLTRAFRAKVEARVYETLTAACVAADERFRWQRLPQREGALWRLLEERPPHLVDPRYGDWDGLLAHAATRLADELAAQGEDFSRRTWGERNTLRVRHPMDGALPLLGDWLDIDARPFPGDDFMPRVQTPWYGASERLAVIPGREEEGYFHMPGGQSGHPMSPFYRAGHQDWVEGRQTPLLSGEAAHRLQLVPMGGGAATTR